MMVLPGRVMAYHSGLDCPVKCCPYRAITLAFPQEEEIVHLNNVTDANLITILQAKEKSASVSVNVTNLQGQQMPNGKVVYQNVPIGWNAPDGAKVVADLIVELAK